jgi:TRAP-type mannitol/chloroaromatic compound transport system permease large subunit
VVPQVSIKDILLGSLPFVLIMMVFTVVLAIFPEIVLWLPNMAMG